MGFRHRLKMAIILLGLAAFAPDLYANEGGGETFVEGVNYLPIKPPLVVNYGGPGKVKYIKAEISIRTDSAEAAKEVSHHMPLVRDTLIMLISSMTDEQVSSGEGKEQMRQQALAKLNEVLELQTGAKHDAADSKDAHAKDEKPKKDAHAKEGKEKDKKDSKDEHSKEAAKPPITDLLFDNLVVQK